MDALTAAAARLAARDAELAAADERLAELLRDAHRQAVEAVRRIEAVAADIESATAGRVATSSLHGVEIGRFLVEKNREALRIAEEAAADAAAKTVALRELAQRYRIADRSQG